MAQAAVDDGIHTIIATPHHKNGRYENTKKQIQKNVFVEFPTGQIPQYAKPMLFDIQMAGYQPIIVHPERNRTFMKHPNKLYGFVRNGALAQLTAASLVGKFGKNVQKLSMQFLEAHL